MIFTGTFNTYDNDQTYSITIGDTGTTTVITDPTDASLYELAASDMIVMFDTEPVTIQCDRQDLTKRIIISQATINLISNQDLTDYLFADTNRSIPVDITLNNESVFFGYVDPLQFNQGYAHNYENISVTATDPLGALEEIKVNQLPYFDATTEISPWNLLYAIIIKAGCTLEYESINASVKTAMQNTKIHATVFFGDSEDDYKNLYEVLEEICKYFNLYVAMHSSNGVMVVSTINQILTHRTISNFKDLAADDSTSLSTDDVYSQIKVTCEIEPVEDLVVSFDDKASIYSDYSHPVRYMTEYVSAGEGRSAWDGFYCMINGNPTNYDECYTRDYYMYALRNDAWDFGTGVNKNYIEYLGGSDISPMRNDQLGLLTWLASDKCRCALVGFGRADENAQGTQNSSIQGYVDVDKYLLISTMGTWGNTDSDFSTFDTAIQSAKPLCKYTGINSNILSPSDERIVNYIIISGSMILNPLQRKTGSHWSTDYDKTYSNTFEDALANFAWVKQTLYESDGTPYQSSVRGCWHHTIPITDNGDGGYYQQKWYSGVCGIYGYLDNSKNQTFKYNYSAFGDSVDRISKIPILACQMKVGTGTTAKYCVERLDQGESGINKFEWLTAAQCELLGIEPYFTLGIDPAIGDNIIGKKWPISNNLDYTVNLDATGTAIPIKASDSLSGVIEFSILGPYNSAWDEITKETHHRWVFWTHTSWDSHKRSILNNIQSIMVNSLKIDMKNNNGGMSSLATTADNDLVYMSNMNPAYIETLDSNLIICTPLTLDECLDWGIKVQTSNSYVYNSDDTAWRGFEITGSGETTYVKPEQCLVDYYYKEYNSPAKIIETKLKTGAFSNGLYGNSMNYDMLTDYFTGVGAGNMMLMSYDANLKDKTLDIRLRECNTISNQQI